MQEFFSHQDLADRLRLPIHDEGPQPGFDTERDWWYRARGFGLAGHDTSGWPVTFAYDSEHLEGGYLIAYAIDERRSQRSGRCLLLAGPWSHEQERRAAAAADDRWGHIGAGYDGEVDLEEVDRWLSSDLPQAMASDHGGLSDLVRRADELTERVTSWITRFLENKASVPSGAAIAFAQMACSHAARGAERPSAAIVLGGDWRTTLKWPLLDVVAAQVAARTLEPLVADEDHWDGERLAEKAERLMTQHVIEKYGVPDTPKGLAKAEARRLREMVWHAEHNLFVASAYLGEYGAREGGASHRRNDLKWVVGRLVDAAAWALAAAALTPEPERIDRPLAHNLGDRYPSWRYG